MTDTKPATLSMWRALNRAMLDEMAADERTFVFGEDITSWGTGGGIHGVTKDLKKTYGAHRVFDTPISEEILVGAAVGSAMKGMRPIVEIMYSDFTLLGFDGIVNQAAKAHFMFGGQFSVPLVLRTASGAGVGKAAQHSQSLETLFAHIPGLEVVMPSTPNDAYGLLRSAIQSPNPTIFLEHKFLYNMRGEVSFEPVPLGSTARVREGTDLTVVASQWMLHRALEAADELARTDGISLDVLDLRTLRPLDAEPIHASVARTGRLLVVQESARDFGWAGEVIARVTAGNWADLTAAPRRIAARSVPIGYAAGLEDGVIPSTAQIVDDVRSALA